jgi:hypothetical protein
LTAPSGRGSESAASTEPRTSVSVVFYAVGALFLAAAFDNRLAYARGSENAVSTEPRTSVSVFFYAAGALFLTAAFDSTTDSNSCRP